MDESEAYKWTKQALRPLNNSGCESHRYQQVADLVASAILEVFKKGRHLTSRSSRAAGACLDWESCDKATSECVSRFSCFKPPPA